MGGEVKPAWDGLTKRQRSNARMKMKGTQYENYTLAVYERIGMPSGQYQLLSKR
jgi:hypothetical protein